MKSRREMHNIFKVLKGKKIPTKNTLSIKVGPQNCRERYRDFQTNKQKKKMEEFTTDRLALQSTLRGRLSAETKEL